MASASPHPAEAARTARHSLGIGIEAPLPDIITTIEEGAGVAVTILEFPERVACAHSRTAANSFVFANGGLPHEDLRFALAYAYAGCALGHADSVALVDDVFGQAGDDAAREAAVFAREFLAPRAAIERSLDRWSMERVDPMEQPEQASRFARYFGISNQVALERLADTDRLVYGGRRWSSSEPSLPDAAPIAPAASWAAVDLLARPRSLEFTELPRMPARLQGAALDAYRFQMISLARLAEVLGQTQEATSDLLGRLGVEQIDVTVRPTALGDS